MNNKLKILYEAYNSLRDYMDNKDKKVISEGIIYLNNIIQNNAYKLEELPLYNMIHNYLLDFLKGVNTFHKLFPHPPKDED